MQSNPTRCAFLSALAALGTAPALPAFAAQKYAGIRFGYTAMTWGDDEREAIDDIAAVGFAGIQFRANAETDFKPADLEELLAQHKHTFVALSSGDVSLEKPAADNFALHTKNAQFVKECGGLYLQVLDELKAYPRIVTPEECKQLGKLLTEIGKSTADAGIPLAYHNHVNTISEHPANLDLVLESSDPKYVRLLLDTAHYVAGGGDPARAIERYRDRILFLHLNSVPSFDRRAYEWCAPRL
jgi:inosose dehydratase